MPSETDIANLALTLIGEPSIAALSDTSDKPSRVCGANYEQARNETLELARWSFAKKQATLSRLTDDPLFKWTAAFQLPTDFIRLVEIEGTDVWTPKEFFDIHGRKLVCDLEDEDATSLNVEYIRREADTTLYSPLFIEALSYKLAIKISVPLTGSDVKAKALRNEFEVTVLSKCMTIDAQQRYSGENHPLRKFLSRSPFIRARR